MSCLSKALTVGAVLVCLSRDKWRSLARKSFQRGSHLVLNSPFPTNDSMDEDDVCIAIAFGLSSLLEL